MTKFVLEELSSFVLYLEHDVHRFLLELELSGNFLAVEGEIEAGGPLDLVEPLLHPVHGEAEGGYELTVFVLGHIHGVS